MRCSWLLRIFTSVLLAVSTSAASAQAPQGTAFTYQGELRQNGAPVTASVDMVFELLDAAAAGNAVAPALSFTAANANPVQVQNGIFTVTLDFGALAFADAVSHERYLKVTVNGSALSPRTKIENAPYALQSRSAELAYAVSNASVGSAQIVASQVQQRVSGNCTAGSTIQSIAQNGTVTCVNNGSGTVTSIGSGSGLTGGPITGSGTLAIAAGGVGLAQIDSSQVQARVAGSCATEEKVLAVGADGTVTCGTDAAGGGTVLSVDSGTGLTGGPISTSGTLSIADGGVGLAQIDANQVQARIGGTCAIGEYVRGINADGSVLCTPVGGLPRITTVDSLSGTGQYAAIAIGSDGLPVMSYNYSGGQGVLRVAHCANAACAGVATLTSVEIGSSGSAGNVGKFTAIAIGTDGLPIVSYQTGDGTLKVAHCANSACTGSALITPVDASGTVGLFTAIAIGTDGLPVISYYDSGNGDLKVAHCANAACTGAATITAADSAGSVGAYTDIAIGSDGFPIVSYQDASAHHLKVAHCENAACTGLATVTPLDVAGSTGYYTSIAIGADGLPVVSYYDLSNGDLKVAHCDSVDCTGGVSLTAVDTAGIVGPYPSIAIGADGLPIVSYYDQTNADLKVAHCASADCAGGAVITALDTTGDAGQYSALAIGADGLPIVSYYTPPTGNLKVVKCNNRFCQ